MDPRGANRAVFPFLGALVCVASLFLAGTAEAQASRHWTWRTRQEWLKSEHEKVLRDADRVVVLARNLRHEIEEMPEASAARGILDRARNLESDSRRLLDAVQKANENFLSVPAVGLAEKIRDQARSLGKNLEDHPARRKLERFRLFCREIEQRSDAVRKRVRAP